MSYAHTDIAGIVLCVVALCVLAFLGCLVVPFLLRVIAKDAGLFSRDMVFEASVSQLLGPSRKALRAHDLDVAWPLRVYPILLV